jgi:NAD(P)-dependent dehydrogenase (short-subunit alcohol dehydrogenase family)
VSAHSDRGSEGDDQWRASALEGISPEVIARFRLDELDFGRSGVSTSQLLSLRGRTALVTGGGGAGSGNATCHRLAEQGANVVVLDVNEKAAESAARAVADRWQVATLAVAADVGEFEQITAAVERAHESFSGIDILVNNAGGSGAIGARGRRAARPDSYSEMDLLDIDTVVRVNFLGALLVTKAVLKGMLARGAGRIINVASDAGRSGVAGLAAYSACKAGVIGFTRSLAAEVGRSGITTVAVCPGIMLNRVALEHIASNGADELVSSTLNGTTMGRASVPDEVASVIAFLASDAASYVQGTAISVSGGWARL